MLDADRIINAAVFEEGSRASDLARVVLSAKAGSRIVTISDNPSFLREPKADLRLNSAEVGLDSQDIHIDDVVQAITRMVPDPDAGLTLLVDMTWVTGLVRGSDGIETWASVAEILSEERGITVLSRYDHVLLVDELVQSAFRAHRQFLARSGFYENPYWLPADLRRASRGSQMSYLLGRIVPDFAGKDIFEREDRFLARGADPDWIDRPKGPTLTAPEAGNWRIHCFGQLRVYRGNQRVTWKIKGGAPKKTRTLFAYLLTKGEKGEHAERIAELLWPGSENVEAKRARLHHTIAMLRKTLGDPEAVKRGGDFYRLSPPEGSWIDISSFEQLCRRGLSLYRRGQNREALHLYRTAEQLYVGDLFQDIPVEYVDDEQEDWCMPRRVWLREMAIKLQRDLSALLREQGKLREALDHCQKALAHDPSSEDANSEAMRVFHAQGRMDAVARQYRQYRKAMQTIDATAEGSEVQALFLALTRR